MMKLIRVLGVLVLSGICACSAGTSNKKIGTTYDVYFLGGQSNMEGFGYVSKLPESMNKNFDEVMIFTGRNVADGEDGGGVGVWSYLEPGFGFEFSTDGKTNTLSDRFGPELSFARQMKALQPKRNVAIIKYSRGGTGLHIEASGYGSWDPDYNIGNGRNQYDNALTSISSALGQRDIDGDGLEDELIPKGLVWMQGEADAFDSLPAVQSYQSNLTRLMDLLRAALNSEELPVVIGLIKDSGDTEETRVMRYSPEIQQAQRDYTEEDRCAILVDVTRDFSFLEDGWHYVSEDYLRLGRAFADEIYKLQKSC